LKFLNRILKNIQISNFMKIRRVGTEFFYVDRRTDMTKLLVAFRKFARAPKNCCFHKSPQANTRVLIESGRGHLPPNPPKFIIHDHDQQHCYHHAPTVKPEASTAVVELLMMGVRTPETW
jgi:hypothetical protein